MRLLAHIALMLASLVYGGGREEPGNNWVGKPAPELFPGRWLNSKELKLAELRGKVVLLEFWTFGCYNCRNTIPTMNAWQKNYAGKDFVIIGVHTPEFDREKDFESVRREIGRLGIRYPVVTDNEYRTWNAYHQEYWPALYVIDKKGVVRYLHIGEGSYGQTEQMIQSLVAEGM